jgi:hypothetical protein
MLVAKRNFQTGSYALPGIVANRQVGPTLSEIYIGNVLDLRERILASHDPGKGTREEIAHRYQVSLGSANAVSSYPSDRFGFGARHPPGGRELVCLPWLQFFKMLPNSFLVVERPTS